MLNQALQLRRDDPVPLYYQLKRIIEGDIERLALKPGDRLPSEYELMRNHNVSRTLIKQTFNVLINEGIVTRIQGKGSFVAEMHKKSPESTGNIGFILCNRKAEEPIYSTMLNHFESAALAKGRHLLFATVGNFYSNEQLPRMIIERSVDGVIVTGDVSPAFVKAMKQSRLPFVMVGQQYEHDKDLTVVSSDELEWHCRAIDYLHKNGHERILLLRGPEFPTHIKAEKVFLDKGGKPENIVKLREVKSSEAYESVLNLLKTPFDFTAIFASDGRLALGALDAIRESSLKVPDDISIVTVGGLDLTRHTNPAISDVVTNRDEPCFIAVEKLINGFESGNMEKGTFLIKKSRLIIRNSAKNISKA